MILKKKFNKILFLSLFLIIFSFLVQHVSAESSNKQICTVYFTYVGCPNCAQTDSVVLMDWTKKYPNLVVIEYMWEGGNWANPNANLLGEYVSKYQSQAAVPQLFINQNNIKLGGLSIPKAEEDIKSMKSNPCVLLEGSTSFENLDLGYLKAYPKVWTNQRILIKNKEDNSWIFQWNGKEISSKISGKEKASGKLLKELLFTDEINKKLNKINFEVVKPQKAKFSGSAFPSKNFVPYAEFNNAVKFELFETSSQQSLSSHQENNNSDQKSSKEVALPLIGKIKSENFSLPVLAFLIGLADGFNPCAFFVLTFLLSALLGLAGSRKKIFIVGGIFVFFSALFYFLFMGAWLNVFLLGKEINILTAIAGAIAIFAGLVNVKDYFFFQKGVSLTLPKDQKQKFMQRVEALSKAKSLWSLIISSIVIAGTVNFYELLCTFGFPIVYTNILTSRNLSNLQYYGYLMLYSLVYIIPLVVIILIFGLTLGKSKFNQLWIKRLKLISGLMILGLGGVLIFNPKLLERVEIAFGLLFLAIIVSVLIIFINSFYQKRKDRYNGQY